MIHNRTISVIGLGYVGLTIAAAFGIITKVIGYDKSSERINQLKKGYDLNGELSPLQLQNSEIHYTRDPHELIDANFHIISVPTPINNSKHPDLSMLLNATTKVGMILKKGDIVVYESSVYPGATEEECIPLLERTSKLKCGVDFGVGFSPERINPGDKVHTFENIIKIVSGSDEQTLDIIANVYESVVKAGVHRVSNIRVAEATKLVENTQRDINISLINELSLMLHSFGMDISEVLTAAKTKWNFLEVQPGLVGGHCIGVNSYYLAHKAQEVGFHPALILAGQRVNDSMVQFIVEEAIKKLIHLDISIHKARIGVLGVTYKENYSDFRESRIPSLIKALTSYDIQVLTHDPIADIDYAKEYGLQLLPWESIQNLDVIILAVPHQFYLNLEQHNYLEKLNDIGAVMDIKGRLEPKLFDGTGIAVWRL